VSRRLERLLAGTAFVFALIAGGCGDGSTTSTPTTFQPEIAQALPKLPPGWKARRDGEIGYAIGIPPGWELHERGGQVLFRSPDHLVAVTLSADRNGEALTLPIGEFATRALAALPGFESPLRPGLLTSFGGTPLEAAQVSGTGREKDRGIEERATVIVLRRDQIVNYTLVVVQNAERAGSRLDRAVALRMVRTLRDQPVETPVSPESR
jgi:hypothetical protein